MSHFNVAWLFGKSHSPEDSLDAVKFSAGPDAQTKTQSIVVAGFVCEVTAHKTGRANWKAYGYVSSMPVQAEGETVQTAFSHWRDLARKMFDA